MGNTIAGHTFMFKYSMGRQSAAAFVKQCKLGSLILITGLSLGKLALAADNTDPFETFNRGVWKFNSYVDRYVMRPVAVGYKKITPDILENGISNIFSNIGNLPTAANNLLQGKPLQAGQDLTRFIFNMTFGGLGLYDIASDIGLPVHQEDVGQTLGAWGVPQGPYIVLPFLGPSGARDALGFGIQLSQMSYPYTEIESEAHRNFTVGLYGISTRAQLLSLDNIAPGDDYLFFRDAYLQRRDAMIRDGQADPAVEDDFLNDEF